MEVVLTIYVRQNEQLAQINYTSGEWQLAKYKSKLVLDWQ
jgi:hypothetical protein